VGSRARLGSQCRQAGRQTGCPTVARLCEGLQTAYRRGGGLGDAHRHAVVLGLAGGGGREEVVSIHKVGTLGAAVPAAGREADGRCIGGCGEGGWWHVHRVIMDDEVLLVQQLLSCPAVLTRACEQRWHCARSPSLLAETRNSCTHHYIACWEAVPPLPIPTPLKPARPQPIQPCHTPRTCCRPWQAAWGGQSAGRGAGGWQGKGIEVCQWCRSLQKPS